MNDRPPHAPTGKVGYKRPPAEHRFKKGASGNPKGRPPAPSTKRSAVQTQLDEIVLKEALRPIQIRENDKVVELPMIQAVVRSLGVSAVKGHYRSQLALAAMVKAVQTEQLSALIDTFTAAMSYKHKWREVFQACDKAGKPRPDPVPHPDEIVLDHKKMTVTFNGPTTADEKAEWDRMLTARQKLLAEVAELQALAEQSGSDSIIEGDIALNRRIVEIIEAVIPDPETRRRSGFDLHRWREEKTSYADLMSRPKSIKRGKKGPAFPT